jgi:hypothetical protein
MPQRLFIVSIALLIGILPASAAALLEKGDFPDGYQTALTFDLSNEKSIRAEILALPGGAAGLSMLELPFGIKNLAADERHVVFTWKQLQSTYLSYNVRPSRSSSLQLASFDPVFGENTPLDALIRNDQSTDSKSNLYFVRDGLQRLFSLQLPKVKKINLEGSGTSEIDVKTPDLIAIRLPQGNIGRAFPMSGRMYEPAPLTNQPPVVIFSSTTPNPTQIFRVRYDLPQPDWVSTATRLGLKLLALFSPALLLYWTKSDKIDPFRYKVVAILVGALFVGIYAYLVYLTVSTSGDIGAITEDIGFAVTNAFVAWLTYWITSKPALESSAPHHTALL